MTLDSFEPTLEQLAIIEAGRSTRDNLCIAALAGAAKTSTLVLLAKALRGKPSLCVAFNKPIALEMGKRLPSHCTCKTLNAVGHAAWGGLIGKRLVVSKDKGYDNFQALITDLPRAEKKPYYEAQADIIRLVSRAKLAGYIPEGTERGTSLLSKEDLRDLFFDDDYDPLAWAHLDDLLAQSITQAWKGLIDFDDQLYMPTLFGAKFPRFPIVYVDEAQDLSPLNHQLVSLLAVERLIVVGDHFQSIYGFRGAVQDGMSRLRDRFAMRELTLSISFRCPIAVVKLARARAPNMQWAPNAEAGEVFWAEEWTESLVPDGAAIICRNNAPLLSIGLRLLRDGRGIEMKGFDISKRLIKQLEDLGPLTLKQSSVLMAINQWQEDRLAEAKSKGKESGILDRAACLRVFAEAGHDLGEAIAYAKKLFSVKGPIELLSIHKSKGLEWDRVFVLDEDLIGKFARTDSEIEQEKNLTYVAVTRAKQSLTFVQSEFYYDPNGSNS